ncbi:MAG: MFS transporter [Candidatus Baldrarchaeia archaeon]
MFEEFRSFPLAARRLIIHYTLTSPFLVVDVIFPVYLFKLGFNVEVAGFLYAISALMSVIFTFLIGKALDKVLSVRTAMSIIEITFGIANFIYAYATSPIHIVLGSLLERIGGVFTVSYQVYERDAYPEEIREKVYVYHMVLPEAAQFITFPL